MNEKAIKRKLPYLTDNQIIFLIKNFEIEKRQIYRNIDFENRYGKGHSPFSDREHKKEIIMNKIIILKDELKKRKDRK